MRLPQGIPQLSEIFAARGVRLFLVGGFVRNTVIGISGGDVDVCSAATSDETMDIARAAGLTVVPKAAELGTVELHLRLNGERYIFEHTTFRSDVYPEGGQHRPTRVAFTDDIEQDARRRDKEQVEILANTNAGLLLGNSQIEVTSYFTLLFPK
jgi:tRNA nucleotidyltransferase/poly(A) polymerase